MEWTGGSKLPGIEALKPCACGVNFLLALDVSKCQNKNVNLPETKLRLAFLISSVAIAISATYLFIISFLWLKSYHLTGIDNILFFAIVFFLIFFGFIISATVLASILRQDFDIGQANGEINPEKTAVASERNKLSVILSGIRDAVIAVDLNRNILTFNASAERVTGYSASFAIGKPINKIISLFDQNTKLLPFDYCPIRTDGFEGVVFSKTDLKLIGADTKQSFVNLTASQIKEGKHVNLGCILTLHDITKGKQLEEMKLDFVSMAAHELRTPLTSIRGYLSVFMEENKDKFTITQNMFLHRISIAVEQLTALTENLLSVSRIERGVFAVSMQVIDWVATVRETIDEFVGRAWDKKIGLILVEPQKPLSFVKADKLRINEVLSNLLSNAISYTHTGGKISVAIEQKGQEVITHIKDTGVGIPRNALPHLFTKFFRVTGKLTQGAKGTGLGLYISKAIVETHGGHIWVESEVNKGSTFSFSLPTTSSS